MSCLPLDSDSNPDQPQRVIAVELEANDGTRWRTVGGGRSLEEAIASARESAPAGRNWRAICIADLYGD